MEDFTNIKSIIKILFIYQALEKGWTVKKSNSIKNGFEFTTNYCNKQYPNSKPVPDYTLQRRRAMSSPLVRFV
jgi:hypothetical protein